MRVHRSNLEQLLALRQQPRVPAYPFARRAPTGGCASCDALADLGLGDDLGTVLDGVFDDLAKRANAAIATVKKTVSGAGDAIAKAATVTKNAVVTAGKKTAKAVSEGAKAAGRAAIRVAKAVAASSITREVLAWAFALATTAALCGGGGVASGGALAPILAYVCGPSGVSALHDIFNAPLRILQALAQGKPVDWTAVVIDLVSGILGFLIPGASANVPGGQQLVAAMKDAFVSGSKAAVANAAKVLLDVLKPLLASVLRGKAEDAKRTKNDAEAKKLAAAAKAAQQLKTPKVTTAVVEKSVAQAKKAQPELFQAAKDLVAIEKVAAKSEAKAPTFVRTAQAKVAKTTGLPVTQKSSSQGAGGLLFMAGTGFLMGGPIGAAAGAALALARR